VGDRRAVHAALLVHQVDQAVVGQVRHREPREVPQRALLVE
jgi:hypothetical protein